MAIPFKSLRYRSGADQVWGIQMRRAIRRKNEWAHLTPVPQIARRRRRRSSASRRAGTLVGLDLPPASKNIELKPYGISRCHDRSAAHAAGQQRPRAATSASTCKYGITANLTADFTVNTDFAQVEVDEQQVNLTRFSLFFPEKRDFFLEGRGIFDFGARRRRRAAAAGSTTEHAVPVLQPPHRPEREPRHPDRRRRPADRQGRARTASA